MDPPAAASSGSVVSEAPWQAVRERMMSLDVSRGVPAEQSVESCRQPHDLRIRDCSVDVIQRRFDDAAGGL